MNALKNSNLLLFDQHRILEAMREATEFTYLWEHNTI